MVTNQMRRQLLKAAGGLALIPFVSVAPQARAAVNAEMRARVQYRDTPREGQNCAACLEFIPGKTDTAPGGCKKIPGDDEISPNGYCMLWNTM